MDSLVDAVTAAYFKAYSVQVDLLYPTNTSLKIFEKKPGSSTDTELLNVVGGWLPKTKQFRSGGKIGTTLFVNIIERDALTADIMSRGNRIEYGGRRYIRDTYDPPDEMPREWTLYCSEEKIGAVK